MTDAHGPVVDAVVRLAPADGDIILANTGTDGIARAELEPGSWRITASAAGHVPAALPARKLISGIDMALTIVLAAGGRALTGTVSDASGGPVAGARVDAARLTPLVAPGDAVSSALSGPDGKYHLTVAEGTLLVAVASTDYAQQSRYVEVGAAGAVADFQLVPGGVVEGVVRDQRTREPIAGASVLARRDSAAIAFAESAAHRATTGGDGRFRLTGLRPGAWELTATAEARHTKAQTVVGLGVAEQVSDIELLVGQGPAIRGRVVDDAGAPVPGITVNAFARGEATEAKVDAGGNFVLDAAQPGDYLLTASGDGFLPGGSTRVTLADHDVTGVIVTVRRGITLRGRVEPREPCDLQIDPEPARGTLMLLPGASSGLDGNFELGPVNAGPLHLTARCDSGDQGVAQITAAPGMAEVIVKVAPGASISGHVVDGSGKPVAGADAMASEVSTTERTMIVNGMVTSGVHGLADASGAYKLDGLAPGAYRVSALDRGRPLRLHAPAPRVELAINEHRTGVDLTVDRADGVITGTVTGPDGKVVADAWVSAQPDPLAGLPDAGPDAGPGDRPARTQLMVQSSEAAGTDSAIPPALTDAAGHYELRGLPHATCTVVAEAQRGELRARADHIKPDATVDLRIAGVATLSGTVIGPEGPVAVFSIELVGPTHAQRSFTDGSYAFGRVDPGSYVVRVDAAEGSAQGTVTIAPGQPATLDLTLTANALVIGRLIDPAGKPLAGQPVALVADSGDGRLQIQLDGPPPTTAADGSFQLSHRAGPCTLVVLRQPRPFTRRGLALEAGKTLDLGAVTVDAPPAGSGAPPR